MQSQGDGSEVQREPDSTLDDRRALILFLRELVMWRGYMVTAEDVADHILREVLATLPDARAALNARALKPHP